MDIIGPMLDENELVLLVYMLAYAFGSSTTPQKKKKGSSTFIIIC
jgi:hypothetical protein